MKHTIPFLLCLFFVIGCKKDDTTDALIIGKWSLRPSTNELYTNGVVTGYSLQNYEASDYLEFKNGGTMQGRVNGTLSTMTYILAADSLTFNNTNTAKITQLTSNSLIYYFKDSINPIEYRISTYFLFK